MNFTEIPMVTESNFTEISSTEKTKNDDEFTNIEKMAIGLSLLGGVILGIIIGLIFYCKKNKKNSIASAERIDPTKILQNNVLSRIRSPDEEFIANYNKNIHEMKTEKADTPGVPESHSSDETIPDLE